MNLAKPKTVEELQRQLEAVNARNSHLEQLMQSQFRGDPSLLNHVAQNFSLAHAGIQLPSHGVQSARSSGLSRSKSTVSYPTQIKSAITERHIGLQAYKRERRAFSQQSGSALPMSRSVSNRSDSQMPFSQTGNPIAPLTNASIDRFCASHDEPANQSLQGSSERLPSVQENQPLSIGMDPEDFLKQWPESQQGSQQGSQQFDSSFSSLSYNLAPGNSFSSLSSNVPCSYPMSSACPSMISGPSAAEAASPLTRQNSSFDSIGAGMTRMESSQSQAADGFFAPDLSPGSANMYCNGKQYRSEHDLFGLGANLSSMPAQQYATCNGKSFLASPDSADMERSASNTSMSSVRSTASNLERRAKEARERVLHAAKTIALAPKPKEGMNKSHANSAARKEAKMPVNKSNYQRPKHPKVYCDQCTEHPDGFRGDHELRRHVNAKHEGVVKKFICRDPATVGIETKVKAVNPLSKCKACTSGKEYGAYYNAAAHLRRTHFKPKTPRGKKGANVDEKRGGKGGGDWPPMSELKAWFVETKVKVDVNDSPLSDEDEGDADMVEAEMEASGMPAQMEMFSGIGSSMSPFDMEANYDIAVEAGADPAMMAGVNGEMGIPGPISSGSGGFGYSPFSDGSPIVGLGDYAFSEQSTSAYGSNLSSSNTITPTTYQDMSQLALSENIWVA
ncbi:hypothetical protein FZEAL_10357 [Fusarium zealandicum]|uniref:DUF7896 domain-containing protein n=1 Tax=Fusarium zealandicum TaxID=1053134 RepID=A0A8H4XBU8_9HYPO|nr:hypothetical protein FZEAL_10357 [Fusarium zealandicum]